MTKPSGLLLAVVSTAMLASCSNTVTVHDMIGDDRYWPQPCHGKVCTLTGNGGIVGVWEEFVDDNVRAGRRFIVKGVCASACEIAYRRAVAKGARVTLAADADLIVHHPQPVKWR